MKNPDENPLLKEVLTDEKLIAFRDASLKQGLDTMRRHRRFRRALNAAALILLPALLIFAFRRTASFDAASTAPPQETIATAIEPKEPGIQIISDEELFALFPGRSLALVGKPGQQQLVDLDGVAGRASSDTQRLPQ